MLITMTALGTAMIDAPLVGEAGPGAIAIGAGEGAFFGGDGTARVNGDKDALSRAHASSF